MHVRHHLPHAPRHKYRHGKLQGFALGIEQFHLLQAVHGADSLEEILVQRPRQEKLVDQTRVIEQPLTDEVLEKRIAQDGVLCAGLHGLGKGNPFGLGLVQKLLPEPAALVKDIDRCQDEKQKSGGEKVTW
jgi:hypothetical protein